MATKIANEIVETVELEVKNHIEISKAEIIEKAVEGEETETFKQDQSEYCNGSYCWWSFRYTLYHLQ